MNANAPTPHGDKSSSAHTGYARGMRTSLLGLLVNAALAIAKLAAGLLGHSYALVADAIESTSDVFASLVVWGGLRVASQPADEDHPYGHGRAEPLAAMVVALMLAVAALGITVEAVQVIVNPHLPPAPFTLFVLLGVIVVKEVMFRVVGRVGRDVESRAVATDAWHHRSDAITSAFAAVGISIALIGGPKYVRADAIAALGAAAVILFNAYRLLMPPLHELMDIAPTEVIDRARRVARQVPDVAGVEKVLARKLGLRYLIDMHIEVDPAMSVWHSHEVAHAVKDAIRLAMPNVADVLVHIEPYNPERSNAGGRGSC
jgi:cation diffusion facilitator family transporter